MNEDMNNNLSDIRKIYEYFENATPVRYDCGNICGKKCCKGEQKDGMLLFPGEEAIFSDNDNFTVYFDEQYESNAVICKGVCNRKERPLACRIFPYFIYSDSSADKLTPAPDIRALDYCPLITEKYEFDRKFRWNE